MGQTGDDQDAGWDDGTLNESDAAKAKPNQSWEAHTAAASPSYSNQIAKSQESDDEFESEDGTAVAGNDYVQNIRESAGPSATALETPRAKESVVAPLGTNAATPVAIAKAAN